MIEVSIGAFLTALGMRIYLREWWGYKVLGVSLMTYGLGGAILWFAGVQGLI